MAAYEGARCHARALGEPAGIELARIKRLLRQDTAASLKALSERSNELKLELAIESGGVQRPDLLACSHLAIDRLSTEPINLRIAAGAKFVIFPFCVSIIVMTFARSSNVAIGQGWTKTSLSGSSAVECRRRQGRKCRC